MDIHKTNWEVVSNSTSMDGIDLQKILSMGSLTWLNLCHNVVTWIAPKFVDRYTQNFGKLPVIVKAWMGLIFRKICQGDFFFGRGTKLNLCYNMLSPG
jgi:hypothetical protein